MAEVATQPELVGDDWAGEMGRSWLANLPRFEGMIQPIGAALVNHAACRPGENVIDIGSGGGATTITLARCVSPGGSATGLDISRELIDACGVRASQGTQSRIFWICGDAASVMPINAPFDHMVSRFGCMFFSDPHAAFANLRRMLKDGARFDAAVWGPPTENAWVQTIGAVAASHLPAPEGAPPPDPHAPGPFAFGDQAYFTQILESAGFGEISFTPCRRDLAIGGAGATPEAAAEFIVSAMHFAKALDEAGPEKRAAAVADLAAALAPYHVAGKGCLLPGMAWLVTARAV